VAPGTPPQHRALGGVALPVGVVATTEAGRTLKQSWRTAASTEEARHRFRVRDPHQDAHPRGRAALHQAAERGVSTGRPASWRARSPPRGCPADSRGRRRAAGAVFPTTVTARSKGFRRASFAGAMPARRLSCGLSPRPAALPGADALTPTRRSSRSARPGARGLRRLLDQAAAALRHETRLPMLLVTRGSQGMTLFRDGDPRPHPRSTNRPGRRRQPEPGIPCSPRSLSHSPPGPLRRGGAAGEFRRRCCRHEDGNGRRDAGSCATPSLGPAILT